MMFFKLNRWSQRQPLPNTYYNKTCFVVSGNPFSCDRITEHCRECTRAAWTWWARIFGKTQSPNRDGRNIPWAPSFPSYRLFRLKRNPNCYYYYYYYYHTPHFLHPVRPQYVPFCHSMATCHTQTLLCHQIWFPVGARCLRASFLRTAKCSPTPTNDFDVMQMFQNEHAFCLWIHEASPHLHSFCATGVSSGLATRVILIRVSRAGWESLLRGGGPTSNFIFVTQFTWLFLRCVLNGSACCHIY
jgi:hypothetical protein